MKISRLSISGAALATLSTSVMAAPAVQLGIPYGAEPVGMAVVGIALLAFGVWRWRKIT